MKLSPNSAYTATDAHDLHRIYQVRLAALCCSGVSVTASIIAFYWFCRMDKLFRHRRVSHYLAKDGPANKRRSLIMLLVYGDVTRSIWYFVFAVYSLARGTVQTESRFCQTSGFFIQYGTETSDYAVLVMAVHSALQVFRPATRGTSDGLFKYRYYVYAGGFVIPVLMASLAFVNPDSAYLSQGAFCTLPLRPFWYRLALTWIPRYLIAFIIISLAAAIYTYVGFEFRSYANMSQSLQTPITITLGLSYIDGDAEAAIENPQSGTTEQTAKITRRASSIAHDVVSSPQRVSAVAFSSTTYTSRPPVPDNVAGTQSLPGSSTYLPLKRTNIRRPSLCMIPSGYIVQPSTNEPHNTVSPLTLHQDDPFFSIPLETPPKDTLATQETSAISHAQRQLKRQRRRIHRQLRLMFIYPLVYTLMWLIPFVQHCMNYSDHWVNHPMWFFRIGATICITSMGFVDCLIFSIREKPWRSIQTSDGSIWGSLAVWRTPRSSNMGLVGVPVQKLERSMTGSERVARARNSVRASASASDDFTRLAAGQARTRLDLEREERLAGLQDKMEKRRLGSGESNYSGKGKGKEKEEVVG